MVVVAIVAILASYGLPAYQDYIRKTRVAEAISLCAGLKIQIADNAFNGRPFDEGVTIPKLTPYLQSITVDNSGANISLTFNPEKFNGNAYLMILAPKDAHQGALLNMQGTATASTIPSGTIAWSCRSAATTGWTATSMPAKYVPEACKGNAYF